MAIDTRQERQAAIRASSWWGGILPNPDGTVANVDRGHLLGMYYNPVAYVTLFAPHVVDAPNRSWRTDAPNRTWRADG